MNWINPAAFKLQAVNMLGNAINPDIQSPRSRDADLSVNKTFAVVEGFKLNFRADCFNFTNTPNYAFGRGANRVSSFNSSTGLGQSSPGFGVISTVSSAPRVFQFALKLLY